ncbi:MAG: pyruvate, phosphate dikinase, partial [Deltaproteobacteria bacterium]
MATKKYVYTFEEGDGKNKKLLGGKGANLREMTQIGIPVPPGFVITTEACVEFLEKRRQQLWPELIEQIKEGIKYLEKKTGKGFGNPENPLLVSVRSGAAISMPGMMDTILNLGMNDEVTKGLAKLTNNERFAYDSYRRFIQLFGSIGLKVDEEKFTKAFEEIKKKYGAKLDTDLDAEALKEVCKRFLEIVR